MAHKVKKTRIKDLYAITLLILIIVQVVVVNAVFICVGLGFLELSDEVLKIFAGCSMPHICGLVYCVVNSVFRAKKWKAFSSERAFLLLMKVKIYAAQGSLAAVHNRTCFPRSVKLAKGKWLSRYTNSVPPPFAETSVRANLPATCRTRVVA